MSGQEPWERPAEEWQSPRWHWRPGAGPPPWVHGWRHWGRGEAPPDWGGANWRTRRQKFFWRSIVFFGAILLLAAGSMAVLAFLLTRFAGGDRHIALLVWIGGCGLSLALPILALALGLRAFRSYALPLADIMSAADAIAQGDLSVRVPERGARDFQQLARSFNHMTAELDRTEQQRRNLTADVAHELRTPLHIIQGNLEGILDGVYEPSAEHIEATLEETRLLARLVEDLRTLSLAESGQLPLRTEVIDVDDLVADVMTSFSGQAETKGVKLRVARDALRNGDAPLRVKGDAGRLDQVLSNLVANALRHIPAHGTITLRAATEADSVQISVSDTGEGIPPDELPFIFDRFWRGDRARTHGPGAGSGLGLSIAAQLVKAHGGQIDVQSTVGQGTTFAIRLPANHPLSPNNEAIADK